MERPMLHKCRQFFWVEGPTQYLIEVVDLPTGNWKYRVSASDDSSPIATGIYPTHLEVVTKALEALQTIQEAKVRTSPNL